MPTTAPVAAPLPDPVVLTTGPPSTLERVARPVAADPGHALGSRAWVLDAVAFHLDVELLRRSSDGLVAVRDAALQVWRSPDPEVRAYLEVLAIGDPEEWVTGPDPSHLVDWYRLLMAPHLAPTRAFRCPDVLRRRLPDLGWPPMEARRLARGRELLTLAER
jgi:hypothetical protein